MDPRSAKHEITTHSEDEQDLLWYFRFTPKESTLKSSYPMMIYRLRLKGAALNIPVSASFDDTDLDHRDRVFRIQRILEAAGPEAMKVLESGLAPSHLPYEKYFGRWGLVAASSPLAQQAYRGSRAQETFGAWLSYRLLESNWDSEAKRFVATVNTEVQVRYRQALATYREGKRRTGCTGRAVVSVANARG